VPSGSPIGHSSLGGLENLAPSDFTVEISSKDAVWREIGLLILHGRSDDDGRVLDRVLNQPHGARPAPGWLRDLQEYAYSGSRRGRRAPPVR
jgi:hypothetical protein